MVTKLDMELMSAAGESPHYDAAARLVDVCSTRHNGCQGCRLHRRCFSAWKIVANNPSVCSISIFMKQFNDIEKSLPAASVAVLETVAIMLWISGGAFLGYLCL